jgi:hypothetical protein
MAYFAKLGINGKVISVTPLADKHCQGADGTELEEVGRQYLENVHGWPLWKKTSYGTVAGKHYTYDENGNRSLSADQSKMFRGNYAGIGFTYDEDKDAFIPPKPGTNWVYDETIFGWKTTVERPTNEQILTMQNHKAIIWDDDNARWRNQSGNKYWDPDTSTWIDY